MHPETINVIRGESKILQSLVGKPNVVQFFNIFETEKFIAIHMEHLKGKQMKRDIRIRLQIAKEDCKSETSDSDSDFCSPDRRNVNTDVIGSQRPAQNGNLFS